MERRKLFSDNVPPKPRRKLFSEEPKVVEESHFDNDKVLCSDCGHCLSPEELSIGYCRCCGADVDTRQKRISLFEEDFQKEFSNTSDPLEMKLKEFSGKEISKDLYEKEFSETERTNLEEKGFSTIQEDGGVKISNSAFTESRLFSTLVVSVTKKYELIPEIMNGGDKAEYIDKLEDISPKGIAILKKHYGIENADNWIEDSGIIHDLGIEFGGSRMTVPEFTEKVEERYPDAPSDIVERLKNLGIIEEMGDNNIEIK